MATNSPDGTPIIPKFPSLPDSLLKRMSEEEKRKWNADIEEWRKKLAIAVKG